MSTKPSIVDRPLRISEVLQAFSQLDSTTQKEVLAQVKRWHAAETSPADRDRVEKSLAAILQVSGRKQQAGPVMTMDERLTPAHQEMLAQMEKAEEAFAATLARLMAERQLTQAQLAEKIGVGQSAIAMLLKRRCRPQRRTIGKLAEALSVSVEELWPGYGTGWKSGLL
jgi:DNA-binding XRE family transcriptional regulator